MPNAYRLAFLHKHEVAESTPAFFFEKPEGFLFVAGQFLRLTIPGLSATDGRGNVRPFSIASAPYEPELMIAIRAGRSEFKVALDKLEAGTPVDMIGPYGHFTLQDNETIPAVFLAGGIGVTPMRSMVLQALREERMRPLYLFYANRRAEDAAFLDEFRSAATAHPTFTLVPTMTAVDGKPWDGERGYITQSMLTRYLPDLTQAMYYSAGPQAMVLAMRAMLNNAGVPEKNMRTELFSGY